MIDFETLPIGTVFYRVYKKGNGFTRNKITFTDEDGNVWHRYDKPAFEYVIKEYELVGRLKKILEGNWHNNPDWELETEYVTRTKEDGITYFDPDELPSSFYTFEYDEAKEMAERKNKELNEQENA